MYVHTRFPRMVRFSLVRREREGGDHFHGNGVKTLVRVYKSWTRIFALFASSSLSGEMKKKKNPKNGPLRLLRFHPRFPAANSESGIVRAKPGVDPVFRSIRTNAVSHVCWRFWGRFVVTPGETDLDDSAQRGSSVRTHAISTYGTFFAR